MRKDKTKFEQEQKLNNDLTTGSAQQASNLRQHAAKAHHDETMLREKELEGLKFKIERKLQEAIGKSRIEVEAKIKEVRESEDIHARE